MSYDLSYWRCREGAELPVKEVYQAVCCDGQHMEGLEALPIDAILEEIAAAFPDWTRLDAATYEKENGGAFQLFTTPQVVRVDCNDMPREEIAKFSELLRKYQCPVYDPQQGARFDTLTILLYGEAEICREVVEAAAARLFPSLKRALRCEPVPEGAVPLPKPEHPVLELFVHRGKSVVKVTASIFFGSGWASRPSQCKIALLTDPEETKQRLSGLAKTVIERAAEDLRQRSFYR